MEKFKNFAFGFLMMALGLYFLIVIVGRLGGDIDGAEAQAHLYCKMVYEGQWPDYQQNYHQFCDKDRWNGK